MDAKNRKAEQELLALQNTLRIINSGNSQTKQSFKKVSDSSDELARLEELEEQARNLNDKVRTKRRKVEEIKTELRVCCFDERNSNVSSVLLFSERNGHWKN